MDIFEEIRMNVVLEVGDRIPEWRVESVPVEKMKISDLNGCFFSNDGRVRHAMNS